MTFDLNNLWVQQHDRANVCPPCGMHAGVGWTSTRGLALKVLYIAKQKYFKNNNKKNNTGNKVLGPYSELTSDFRLRTGITVWTVNTPKRTMECHLRKPPMNCRRKPCEVKLSSGMPLLCRFAERLRFVLEAISVTVLIYHGWKANFSWKQTNKNWCDFSV